MGDIELEFERNAVTEDVYSLPSRGLAKGKNRSELTELQSKTAEFDEQMSAKVLPEFYTAQEAEEVERRKPRFTYEDKIGKWADAAKPGNVFDPEE